MEGKGKYFKLVTVLVVVFFVSFSVFTVPRAHATATQGVVTRLVYRAISPSTVASMGSGTSLVIGVAVAVGVAYLIVKSGALDDMRSWYNSAVGGDPAFAANQYGQMYMTKGNFHWFWWQQEVSGNVWFYASGKVGSSCSATRYQDCQHSQYWGPGPVSMTWTGAMQFIGNSVSPSTVPVDYVTQLGTSQPNWSDGEVYGTPGAIAALTGAGAIVSAVAMSNADADKFISGSGATPINTDGTQVGSPPSVNDNTFSQGDSQQVGLLQAILNYVSNLLGIKADTSAISVKMDNVATGVGAQTAKMDNVVTSISSQTTAIQAQSGKLDNIAVSTSQVAIKMDNVATNVQDLKDAVTEAEATTSSLSTRIAAVKDLALTKFPFSLASALVLSAPEGAATYSFPSLPLTESISVPINPLGTILHDFFVWCRQILVYMFWLMTIAAMLRKVMVM